MEKEIKYAPLQEETKKLKNGIELTVYSGGKVEDYGLSESDSLEILVFDDNDAILGVLDGEAGSHPRFYSDNDKKNKVLHKVKIKFKNGEEYIGFLNDAAIKNLEETKILPLVKDIDTDSYFLYRYSLINLENGNGYEMSGNYYHHEPLSSKFIEGHYSDMNDGCINLETMKPIFDKNGEDCGAVTFDMKNGVFVSVGYDDDYEICFIGAYKADGTMIDELKISGAYTYELEHMWRDNIQIIYEKGKFYKVKDGKKSELDFELVNEVNPM